MNYKEFSESKREKKECSWRKNRPRKDEVDNEISVYDYLDPVLQLSRDTVNHPSDPSLRAMHTNKGASHMYCPEIAMSFCMGWKRENRRHNREVMRRYRKKTRMSVKESNYDIKPLLRKY